MSSPKNGDMELNNTNHQKGCLCITGKHPKSWHCLVQNPNLSTFYADFPFNNPPTKGTGLWQRSQFHKIKNWGKRR